MQQFTPISPEFTEWYILHCEAGQIAHFVIEVHADGVGIDLPPLPLQGLLASYLAEKHSEGYALDVVALSDGAITYYLWPKDAPAALKQQVYDTFLSILLNDMGVIL